MTNDKKSIMNKFADVLLRYWGRIANGSLTFTIHFRNGTAQKVEVDAKEHFGCK